MSEGAFGGRLFPWFLGVCIASFLGGLLLLVFAPDLSPGRTHRASAYSRSALGHQALVATLRRLGVPVVVSRSHSADKVGEGGLLVVAEPDLDGIDLLADGSGPAEHLAAMVARAHTTLLVLPKWDGPPDRDEPAWVDRPELVDLHSAEAALHALGIDADLRRVSAARLGPGATQGTTPAPTFFADWVQVIEGPGAVGMVETTRGALVATLLGHDGRLVVLADPDPISNAGLHRGQNAAFALELIDRLRAPGGTVVFDETLHGHEANPSIWRELFDFPLVLVPLQLVLLLGALLWATMGRFGAPQRPAPALEPGTAFLVSNTADLLRHGASTPKALIRYLDLTRRQVAEALNAPPALRGRDLDAWLDRVAERRGVTRRLTDLHAAVAHADDRPHRVRAVAQDVHQWREEILHGSVRRTHVA